MKKIIAVLILFYSVSNFSQNIEKKVDNNLYVMQGIEVKPEFPGGVEKLHSYIKENLKIVGVEMQTTAKVKTRSIGYANFVVEKDGSLSNVKVLGKIDSRKSEELIRVLKNSPIWTPGKQNKTIVRVDYVLPLY